MALLGRGKVDDFGLVVGNGGRLSRHRLYRGLRGSRRYLSPAPQPLQMNSTLPRSGQDSIGKRCLQASASPSRGGAFLVSGTPLWTWALVESRTSGAFKHEVTAQHVKIEIRKPHRVTVATQIIVAAKS
jgi:hypothetical protein